MTANRIHGANSFMDAGGAGLSVGYWTESGRRGKGHDAEYADESQTLILSNLSR